MPFSTYETEHEDGMTLSEIRDFVEKTFSEDGTKKIRIQSFFGTKGGFALLKKLKLEGSND